MARELTERTAERTSKDALERVGSAPVAVMRPRPPHAVERLRREGGAWMRLILGLLTFAVLVNGCANWHLPPPTYDGRSSCELAGGFYTSDGRCLAGNID